MALGKTARVVATAAISAQTRLIALTAAEPLGFVGGQYVIVDSGVMLPSGKRAKRAYSILSSDAHQDRMQLAVLRVEGGAASGFMHGLSPGDEVPFSGPWGKYLPEQLSGLPLRRTLVLATDTGITCALGLVCGEAYAPERPGTELVWVISTSDYFLPEKMVRDLLPAGVTLRVVVSGDRLGAALTAAREARALDAAYLSGDGAILYPVREALPLAPEKVRLEAFFNNPERKAASETSPAALTASEAHKG